VEQAEKVQVRPGDIDQEPERDTPQPAPEERPVDVRRFQWDRLLDSELRAEPQREQDVAEEDHGQCAYNPSRETDCDVLEDSHDEAPLHYQRPKCAPPSTYRM